MVTKIPQSCWRDQCEKLLTLLHFQDYLSVSEDAKKDKMWKLRPWLEKLWEQCLPVPLEEHHASWFHSREDLWKFTCQQNLTNGRSKYGDMRDKMWIAVRLWRLSRCSRSRKGKIFGLCEWRCCPQIDQAFLQWRTTVFTDKYFTSLPLLEQLRQRGIYYLGTIRMNRLPDCSM